MFRFTIRDLLWLTLVVAMGLGWFVHQRRLCADNANCQMINEALAARATKWRSRAGALEEAFNVDGWTTTWEPWAPLAAR
jgi:hypothetical protein